MTYPSVSTSILYELVIHGQYSLKDELERRSDSLVQLTRVPLLLKDE